MRASHPETERLVSPNHALSEGWILLLLLLLLLLALLLHLLGFPYRVGLPCGSFSSTYFGTVHIYLPAPTLPYDDCSSPWSTTSSPAHFHSIHAVDSTVVFSAYDMPIPPHSLSSTLGSEARRQHLEYLLNGKWFIRNTLPFITLVFLCIRLLSSTLQFTLLLLLSIIYSILLYLF